MTQPTGLEAQFAALPADVVVLNRVIQGLFVHCAWLSSYGTDPSAFGSVSRTTLPVGKRLAALLEQDGKRLDEPRAPTQRAVVTCRDFALTLCAVLRSKGTPARLRCGFASYFGNAWEDHWLCEYWDGRQNQWCLSDAQLDPVMRSACGISFNTADVPRDVFMTAGEAWLQCRAGEGNPDEFGNEGTRGLWFMNVNVVRDCHVVNNRETSAWDRWREAPREMRLVQASELLELDSLAGNPEAGEAELIPAWLQKPCRLCENSIP